MDKALQKLGFIQTIDFDNFYKYYYRPIEATGTNLWFRHLKEDITDSILYMEIGGDQSVPVRRSPSESFIKKFIKVFEEE